MQQIRSYSFKTKTAACAIAQAAVPIRTETSIKKPWLYFGLNPG
ncbi:MAG: hypothetical protein ACRC0B_00305 [Legionella sp.]